MPFFSKPYPIPINYREKVKQEIDRWIKLGIIRRSTSPYINPLVVVIKKDKSVRLCLDARKLNEKLIDDYESPPGVEELILRFKDVKFMCDNKIYEFNVVPFSIKTSSAALIRGLDLAVSDLKDFLITFVDDLLCLSNNFETHLENLQLLFDRLPRNNLRLNFKKSNFVKNEINFLGHTLSPEGLKPDPEKIKMIKHFRRPRNIRELQAFLGFVNFYAKFAKNYSAETIPLIRLLKRVKKYEWTEEHEKAFNKIKNLFDKNIILKYAHPGRSFILTTDASDHAIAAVLSQMND